MDPVEQPVLVSVSESVGRLTLNRPEAINALSREMVDTLTRALLDWIDDPEVSLVVIDGAGDRGFCAGGDIRELWVSATSENAADARAFFREEYRLNALIAAYPKPVVAIMDGIAMGGGIGLGGHASIRIVTERSRLAMPETRIGFLPDVGGTWLLARAPGETGTYLAANAATMLAADAIEAGFADYFVPSDRLPDLLHALAERADPGTPSEIVLLFDESPDASGLAAHRDWIDAAYDAPTGAEIIERLRARPEPEAQAAADELAALSPTAIEITLAAVRAARAMPVLEEALEQEYRAAAFLIGHPDLHEGIRAQVIDKDRQPRWADLEHGVADAALAHDPGDRVFG